MTGDPAQRRPLIAGLCRRLWLASRAGGAEWLAALVCLVVYGLTLVPEVGWGDPAELALQAHQLGVTHPPGYPVHTILGRLFGLLIPDPALATNLLSAVCTALAVGVLAALARRLTGDACAGLAAGLIFGLSPQVWEAAVKTEVYNVNMLVLAVALALVVAWHRRPIRGRLGLGALAFGLSLGSYLANLLVAPGLAFLIWWPRRRPGQVALFLAVSALVGGLLLSWSYWRAGAAPPIGVAEIPDSPARFLSFLAGGQYGALRVHSPRFYLGRCVDHGLLFAGGFAWLGMALGLVGLARQWQRERGLALGLLGAFALNIGYFTGYTASDYYTMVTPSYFIFSLWLAYGIQELAGQAGRLRVRPLAVVAPLAVVGALVATQAGARVARSQSRQVTDFCLSSFATFPANATVIARWGRYAPLVYFQRTQGLRPDVTLVERSDSPRAYPWGVVSDWRAHACAAAARGPVVSDDADLRAPEGCRVVPLGPYWHQITCPP